MRLLKETGQEPDELTLEPEKLAKLTELADSGTLTNTAAKEVFAEMFQNGTDPETYMEEKGLKTVRDEGQLRSVIETILNEHPQSVQDYQNGKQKAIGYLVGQTMKATQGKARPVLLNQILKELLAKH